jgi:hypothetical protein
MAATEEAAPLLLKALVGEERVDANQELTAPLTLELLIFGLHLTDRIAFGQLGDENRSGFMNALCERPSEPVHFRDFALCSSNQLSTTLNLSGALAANGRIIKKRRVIRGHSIL